MKNLATYFAAALFATQCVGFNQLTAETSYQTSSSSINWTTDYQAALQKAASENKPVLLFFTGSDWCTWCHRLEQEVLDTKDFSELAGNKFIFVEVDFPRKGQLDSQVKQQNSMLQKKYNITGYPTIVLIDSKENILGTTGYQQGGAKSYVEHLNQFLPNKPQGDDFQALKSQYQKTKDLALIERGLIVDQDDFFAKEQYAQLIKSGKIDDPETSLLKEKLLKDNSQRNHYFVALKDFEELSSKQEKGTVSSNDACAPLIQYLDKHGENDKQAWRMEATVAETYYSTKHYSDALKWATSALDHAPQEYKEPIEKLISSIESDQKSQIVLDSETPSDIQVVVDHTI